MKIRSEHEFLFKQEGAKRWLKRNRLPKPMGNALFPLTLDNAPVPTENTYLYALDSRALRIKEELADRLTAEFPVDVLPSGFAGPTTVPGDFYSLRNVSGYGMDPLPIPVANNDALVKANGVAERIRPGDEVWLREIIRLFFGHAVPANLHIRKAASTGFPYFTTDNQYKKLATLKALQNPEDFLSKVTGDKSGLTAAANDYHAMLIYAIQERQQPNAVSRNERGEFASKPRTAPTEEEARSGSSSGKRFADMTVYDQNGNEVPGHFGMRRRDVFGMNGIVNYFTTAIVGCFREVYLNRFAFTYKTRDRHDKKQKIDKYSFVVGSDVKTMDKMIPRWFTTFFFEELTKYLDDRVVELLRRMFQAPYVVPPPWRKTAESYDPVFGGSPLDPGSFAQHVGLPSGISINPDLGKLWMTFVYVILYRDCGAIYSPADIEPLLRGLNPQHALLDMSDDAAFLTNSAIVAERFRHPKSPYAVLEVETPVIFLGDVFCQVGDNKEVYPNPLTYVVNALCREDSIDRKGPVAWAEGYLARFQVYSSNPIFRDLNGIASEVYRRHLSVDPHVIARTLAKQQRFNDVDAMVRMSPHYLFYRVDPKDVSPEVLDEVVATIPHEDFFSHIRKLFKVPVNG